MNKQKLIDFLDWEINKQERKYNELKGTWHKSLIETVSYEKGLHIGRIKGLKYIKILAEGGEWDD